MKKIVFFCDRCPPTIGGVENHIGKICREASVDKLVDIVLVADPSDISISNLFGFQIIYSPSKASMFKKIFGGLRKEVIKVSLSADIVHFHDYSSVATYGFVPFVLRLVLRKPVYITFHGWEGVVPPKRRVVLFRRIVNYLSQGSIQVGGFISKWYGTKSLFTIIGGVDRNLEFSAPQVGSCESKAYFVGRLAEDTGIESTIAGWEKVLETPLLNLTELIVLGDGPLADKMKCLVSQSQKLSKSVKFLGAVKEPFSIIQPGAIVFTSGYLGMLEAFANRNRVISFYDNNLKSDYLSSIRSPARVFWKVNSTQHMLDAVKDAVINLDVPISALKFAKEHSWYKVYQVYCSLWGIHSDASKELT